MWNAVAPFSGPTALFAGATVLGGAIRALFKYPHLWRYLEARHRLRRGCSEKGKRGSV